MHTLVVLLLLITALSNGHLCAFDKVPQLNRQLEVAVRATDYKQVEKLINEGAEITSLDYAIIRTLKHQGFHAKKRSEEPNNHYMVLRVLKKHGAWIGIPYEGNTFDDPVLDDDDL
jgi:hypothetical protein